MATKNRISLIGRLGGNPELKKVEGERMVCVFSLATNERYRNQKGEWSDAEPDWHRIAVWGKRGEAISKLIAKGDLIGVEGRLSIRGYEKEGIKFTSVQVVADEILFLKNYEPKDYAAMLASAIVPNGEDDLPF